MNGFDILKTRRAAKTVSQESLRRQLGLVHRCSLTDIESGSIEVTDAWAYKAISAIQAIKDRQATEPAAEQAA